MTGAAAFGPWTPGLGKGERLARWRTMRALALVFVGPDHPLTAALRAAELDQQVAPLALELLDALPALRRRRLLATYSVIAAPPRPHRRKRATPGKEPITP
jgi:hypothetical protein